MSMDDDLDDYELFWSTIVSHIQILSQSVANFGDLFVKPVLKEWCNQLVSFVMRPQTLVAISMILILALICHVFEYWFKSALRSAVNLAKRVNIGLTIVSTALSAFLPNVECITRIVSDNIVDEFKDSYVGIYAIQGRRPKMEDRFTYVNDTTRAGIEYWAVFDGHGGDSAAIYVESKLYEAIRKRVEELITKTDSPNDFPKNSVDFCIKDDPKSKLSMSESSDSNKSSKEYNFEALTVTSLSKIVTEEVLEIDRQLVVDSKEKGDVSGSTALIALRNVAQNKLIVANVGDSRAVICDGKGATIPLSFDHKPQQLKEHKRIKEAGGFIKFNGVWRVAGILATSRAMGDYPLKDTNMVIAEPDILTFNLNDIQPKFMILATDGLWDTFTNEEAVAFAKESLIKVKQSNTTHTAHEVAKNLVFESYRRGSLDNITVIFVVFDDNFDETSNSL
ncbi:protein phosphatase 1L-like [Oppia nitens]|uniref:protein phosphatase 1L-like n=1 Tax=Oppia nitens TaxID=1686743 RepID=UPI0023D9E667|nr:protein phosphatase 1L-like [Oppia nitens]